MTTSKVEQLQALARKRKAAHLEGFKNLSDFDPRCECDFVSPVTKSAGNINSDIFVFLQDWSSEDEMNKQAFDPETDQFGYTPSTSTFKNLIRLLHGHLGKSLAEIYATNLFPLIKPGRMSAPVAPKAMIWAATEFGIPQIDILKPRLIIALGGPTFDALSKAAKHPIRADMAAAIEAPFDFMGARIWCQSHTSGLGIAKRGGKVPVDADWQKMAAWYRGRALQPESHGKKLIP